jgi:hypothetical protein
MIGLEEKETIIYWKQIYCYVTKDILGTRIPIKIKLMPHITYKLLALVDTGCTKNIIHDKYFIKCP